MFNEYPYVNLQDVNLDWILKHIKDLETNLQDFIKINTIKYADPIIWNISTQYEANTVVVDGNTGTAYLSVQPVPSGVALTNTDYWTVIFTLDLLSANQNITFRDDGTNVVASFSSVIGDWILWNFNLYKVIRDIPESNAYLVGYNLERYTVELFVKDYIDSLYDYIGSRDDLITTDKSSIVNSINSLVLYLTPDMFGAVGDGETDDTDAFRNCVTSALSDNKPIFVPDKTYKLDSVVDCSGVTCIESAGTIDGTLILGGNLREFTNSFVYNFRNITGITLKDSRGNFINVGFCDTFFIDSRENSNYYNHISGAKIRHVIISSPETEPEEVKWANDNAFYIKHIVDITINGVYRNNNNNFYDCGLEDGFVNFSNARSNYITCRGEDLTASNITFDENCFDNHIYDSQRYEQLTLLNIMRFFTHHNGNFYLPRACVDFHVTPLYDLAHDSIGNVANLVNSDGDTVFTSLHTGALIDSFNIRILEDFGLLLNSDGNVTVEVELYEGASLVTSQHSEIIESSSIITFNNGVYRISSLKNSYVSVKCPDSDVNKYTAKIKLYTGSTTQTYHYIRCDYVSYGFAHPKHNTMNYCSSTPSSSGIWKTGDIVYNNGTNNAITGWRYGSDSTWHSF